MFPQQLLRQPRAPLGSDLFDEKELRPETLRPDRCHLQRFGPLQGVVRRREAPEGRQRRFFPLLPLLW